MPPARDIYQAHIDAVTDALWERDFDRAMRLIRLPHRRVLGTRDVTVEDRDVLRAEGGAFRAALDGLGATGFIRICRGADFVYDDRIDGQHESYVVRGGTYQVQPYIVRVRLVRDRDRWLAAECCVPDFPIPLTGYPDAMRGHTITDEVRE